MPNIIFKGITRANDSIFDEVNERPKNAKILNIPENNMLVSLIFAIPLMIFCFCLIFVKKNMMNDFPMIRHYIPIGIVLGFLCCLIHELLHAIPQPKGAKVYIGFIVNSLLTILTSIDNPCDMTVMMDLWPVVLILLAIYVLKEKKKDILVTMCLVVALILNAYYIFAMPEWLAKITLFSRTWYGRVYQVFGLLNIFMLFRVLSNTEFKFKSKWAIVISAILSIICVLISKYYYPLIITKGIAIVLVFAFTLIFYSVLMANQKKKTFFTVIVLFMILIGGLINPKIGRAHV